MIIELIGLPGSGKTALAEAMKAHEAVLVPLPARVHVVKDAFLFWLAHPFLAIRLLFCLLWNVPSGVRYELFINGYLGYAARYRRALFLSRQGLTAVLDQGFLQLIVSLRGLPEDLLRNLPKPDVLVALAVEARERERRMAARGWAPRASSGAKERLAWQEDAEKALEAALPMLADTTRVFRYDGMQLPQEGARALMEFANRQAGATARIAPARDLMKTVLAAISFVIARPARAFSQSAEVVVLMYHAIDRSGWKLAVSPEAFERQMQYLAHKGWAVPLADVVAYAKGEKKLGAHAVAVTFDDGYRDLVTTVLPIITKHRIPISVFIPSSLTVRSGERAKRDICTWEELRMLQSTGLVNIESHSRTHAHLSRLSLQELMEEVGGSADDIERELGVRPRYHAYPYGERSPVIETEAAKIYAASFGITEGMIRPGDAPSRLKRVQIDGTMSFFLFRLRLTSAVDWNRRFVDWFRHA